MMKKLLQNTFGYTLIEVLIVLVIMGILFGAGYANYRSFSRRQTLQNVAKTLQADLRLAQSTALSAQLPTTEASCIGINNLNGYFFTIVDAGHYEIRASCTGGAVATIKKSVVLPAGITITTAPFSILFKVLGSGTNINVASVSISVSQAGTTDTATITVTKGGQIQ